jgi:simple sugar transport system ATP-binding protein
MVSSLPSAAQDGRSGGAPVVEMRGIWKRFPGVVANQGVDFDLRAGEVHALLGENGAGKTTLMKILSGGYRPDAGTILVDGKPVTFRSPAEAIELGIGMVHQHFRLVQKMTAAENIHIGWEEAPWNVASSELTQRTQAISKEFGLQVHPSAKIWQLSTGEQQRVEILRVLARGARVLILDEPTAVLTPNEVTELFHVVRRLAAGGRCIVFISHKLDEVLEVSDRLTVLREGRRVDTCDTEVCNQRMLARMMVGEDVVLQERPATCERGEAVLQLRDARAIGDRDVTTLKGVDLSICEGEILGVAGVAGNGQSELAEVLTGLRPLVDGSLRIDGVDLTGASAARLAVAGVGHIPEDRLGTGLVPGASVAHNAVLREYRDPPISSGIRILWQEAKEFARNLVREADVRVPNVGVPVRNLSGGNQQRLLAGRETRIATRLLVAVHPTRGLDIAAADSVRRVIAEHRNAGVAILLISEDLDEVLAMSDRIVVMYEGEVVGEFTAEEADREEIGLRMGGASMTEADS